MTEAIRSDKLQVGVTGKMPLQSDCLLVRLSSNKDTEILVQAVQENERHRVKCTVPKF